MLDFSKFSGINNVLPSERVVPDPHTGATPLVAAMNVDIGLSGEIKRRAGYSVLLDTCHKNLFQAEGFMLATVDGGDLIAMDETGGNRVLLYQSLGTNRVWYCNLPDGRTTFSNGLINGITNGATVTGWGVPIPASLGTLTPVTGALFPGDYQYQLTYMRLSDKLEGGPLYSNPIPIPGGGVLLTGLPVLDGYSINVYLTPVNGAEGYLAGNTTSNAFSYLGKNDALTLPCRTDWLLPMPAGTVTAFWRGRVLVAVGSLLCASRSHQWEQYDPRRDFKQLGSPITLIQPVDDGVYVGTTSELAFLSGTEFDKLVYKQVMDKPTVLGSGVLVRGELLPDGHGSAMIAIAGGIIVAGLNGGELRLITQGRYTTAASEVCATLRMVGDVPQYLAVSQ